MSRYAGMRIAWRRANARPILLASIRAALGDLATDQERQAARKLIHDRLALLSNRERDVLEGLVAGNPNKIIAYELGISPHCQSGLRQVLDA